jgi:histidinol-phosphate aminotransferase
MTMDAPAPLGGIMALQAYQPGAAVAPGPQAHVAQLAQNEAALGPSPRAIEAVRLHSSRIDRYPDPTLAALRQAIGRHYDLDPSRLVCGTGSEALLHLVGRCYLRASDEVLFSRRAFAMYPLVTRAADATPVPVEEGADFALQVDAFLAAVTSRTKIVFLANPNNPTGAVMGPAELARLHAALPRHVLLVIDAAYQDYMSSPEYRAGFELVAEESGNVLVLGTFSKAFALAGLRLGWAYGSRSLIDVLGRVRPVFGVPRVTAEAAIAALEDSAHLGLELAHVHRYRPWFAERLAKLGCAVPPPAANFVVATLPEGPGSAADAFAYLAERGVLVRPLTSYGLPRSLRISIGPEPAMHRCLEVLAEFIGAARR